MPAMIAAALLLTLVATVSAGTVDPHAGHAMEMSAASPGGALTENRHERSPAGEDQAREAPAVVVSVNGAVTAAQSPAQAVALAVFLEDAARVELAALNAGLAETAPRMNEAQARNRATWQGRIAERMWEYLSAGGAVPGGRIGSCFKRSGRALGTAKMARHDGGA